jgi:hypothetical protein
MPIKGKGLVRAVALPAALTLPGADSGWPRQLLAPFQGSWWAHAKAKTIFQCSRAVRNSSHVLVCRLVGGKVT